MGLGFCSVNKQRVILLPSEDDIKEFNNTDEYSVLIEKATDVFGQMKTISEIPQEAKASLSNTGDKEKQLAAVKSLEPTISIIVNAYHLTKPISTNIQSLLSQFASDLDWKDNVEIIYKLLRLLCNCFLFDSIKMANPRIHNTLFFYRRCSANVASIYQLPLSENESSEITTFLAEPQPLFARLLANLADHRSEYVEYIAVMKTLCASLIQALQEDLSEEVADVYCHSLTLLILLIDNIQSGGVFTAKAGVNVVKAVQVLQKWGECGKECLMNLRYSSKTFTSPSISKKVKKTIMEATN